MTTSRPVEMVWDGNALRPVSGFWERRAAKEFVAGEVYRIADQPERSHNSHAHFFASVQEAWRNLPEQWAERFPTADHLRRYALIKAGYCNTQSMPCGSAAAAQKFAAFVRPMDDFALVTVDGSVVTVYTAKSQSYRAMDKADFQRSKEQVLEIVAEMIGVTKPELERQGDPKTRQPTARDYLEAG